MAFGDLLAEFYTNANPPVSQGIITTVVDAGGGLALNEITENNFCLLPNQMPAADHAKIVDGGICHVYIEDDVAAGGSTDICTFIIEKKVVEGSGRNTFLRLSGPDQLREMRERLVNKIISKEETGTAQDTSPTTITLAAGTPDRTGWTVSVPATQPHDQGIVIESHDTGSQVATLAFGWTPTPSSNTTYKLSEGIADPTDLNSIATQLNPFASGIWTLEVEGGNTGTANGSYVVGKGESVLRILQIVQEQSLGEFFRLKSLTPSVRTVEWRRTNASSGITITGDKSLYSNPAYALVVPGTMQAERVDRRFTRIYPYGAGMGPSSLTVISSTINPATLYTGFALINDAAFPGINNTSIETATFHRGAIKTFAEIQAANGTATQQVAAANALMRAAAYWLKQHDGFVWEYRCSVYSHSTLKPGDTIDISWTDPGQNPQTITATGLYIQSAKSRVQKGQKIADLYLTATFLPSNEDTKTVGNHLRTMMGTLRHSEASIGTVSTGGGVIGAHDHGYLPLSGGHLVGDVTLDADVLVDGRDISDDGATLDIVAALAHNPITLATSAQALLALSPSQQLSIPTQAANTFLAGPTSGAAAAMSIRALHVNDIPQHEIIDKHIYAAGGSALDVVGLSAPSTLAMLTPSSDTSGGGAALLKSTANGDLKVRRIDVGDYYQIDGNRILSNELTNNLFIGTFSGEASATNPAATTERTMSLGASSLKDATAAIGVVSIGTSAMQSSITVSDAVGIGEGVLINFNGFNVAVVGSQGFRNSTNVQAIAALGAYVGYSNTTGIGISLVGDHGFYNNTTGNFNSGVGNRIGYLNVTGSGNTFWGNEAGYNELGSNKLYMANNSTTNPLVYGEYPNTLARLAAQTVELGDGTNATTLKARTADLTLDVVGGDFLMKTTTDISGESWVSGFLGSQWGIDTGTGHGDFRSIYADELRVTHFIAEAALTKVGSLWITKSQGTLTRDITLGSVGGGATLYVEDAPGVPNTAVFSSGDYVLLRKFKASGDSLVVASAWGQVTSYSDLSGGEQSWTFTLRGGDAAGETINSGSVALDFGQSGDGYITMTTLDNAGSPYAQIATWRGNPYTASNRTVHTRWGNLDGLAGIEREFGLYAGISPTSARIVATDTRVALHSVPLSLYSGGDNQILILFSLKLATNLQSDRRANGDISQSNVNTTAGNYYSVLNDSTSSYLYNSFNSSNAEAWFDLESITTGMSYLDVSSEAQAGATDDGIVVTAQLFKSDGTTELTDEIMLANQDDTAANQQVLTKRFGYVDSAASQADWNGARLRLRWYYYPSSGESEVIRLDPFVPSIAVGDPLPTAVNVGDGIWMGRHDATGTYRFRVGHATGPKLLWNASSLALYDSGGNVAIDFAASGNAKISGTLNLGTSGGIYQGTGTFASPSTGLKLWNDSGVGRIAGYNGGTLQAGFDTDGKLTAGGGVATLDASGVKIQASTAYSDTRAYQLVDTSGNVTGVLGGQVPSPAIASLTRLMTKGISGRSSTLQLYAEALSTNSASVHISAYNGGADAGFLITPTNVLLENGGLTLDTLASTPTDDEVIYRKGTKLIIKYLDSGTVRYKYLELSGTGATWTHTTTAP